MKLYVYDHCPFCVRARMIFGLKNLPVELVVIAVQSDQIFKCLPIFLRFKSYKWIHKLTAID